MDHVTVIEGEAMTEEEIMMTTIHVITIQDQEIMIDDQMMKILRRPIQDGEIWIRTAAQTIDQMDITEVVKVDHVTVDTMMDHVMTLDMMTVVKGGHVMTDHEMMMADVDQIIVDQKVEMIPQKPLKLMSHGPNFNH